MDMVVMLYRISATGYVRKNPKMTIHDEVVCCISHTGWLSKLMEALWTEILVDGTNGDWDSYWYNAGGVWFTSNTHAPYVWTGDGGWGVVVVGL